MEKNQKVFDLTPSLTLSLRLEIKINKIIELKI